MGKKMLDRLAQQNGNHHHHPGLVAILNGEKIYTLKKGGKK
jgi:hypothetical protein